MLEKLTRVQGFNAVFKLFEIYYRETGSENITTMLSSMTFSSDQRVFDAGMWEIWIESIDKIFNEEGVKNHEYLTALQTFKAIPLYLEGFYGTDFFADIMFLVSGIRLVIKDKSTDSVLWKQWMLCVNNVLSVEDSRYYGKAVKTT